MSGLNSCLNTIDIQRFKQSIYLKDAIPEENGEKETENRPLSPCLQKECCMPEVWDVYDVNRQRTGKTILRENSWGNERYHLIVHVGIFNREGKMLIQKRCHQKRAWPDLWDVSAGGSALAGEESWQAAERETMEEIGLRLNLRDVRPHFSINYERGFDDFYAVTADVDPENLTFQETEVAEAKWASLEEIREMLQDHRFTPYFPGVLELLFQTHDNYDGAICQK